MIDHQRTRILDARISLGGSAEHIHLCGAPGALPALRGVDGGGRGAVGVGNPLHSEGEHAAQPSHRDGTQLGNRWRFSTFSIFNGQPGIMYTLSL